MSHLMKLIPISMTLMACALSHAQTYEQVAPQTPETTPASPPVLPESGEKSVANDSRVLSPELRGLVFVSSQSEIKPEGVSITGLQLSSVPLLDTPAFRGKLETRLGKPLTLGGLQEITREAVLTFRAADRPIVDVSAPEQNIHSGTIQMLVTEGRLGQVKAEGNRWFASKQLTDEVRATPGGSISGSALLDDLVWLNQNPFRRVDLVFARGAESGETDIILRTQDRRPWRVFGGYDNSGTPLTDEDRLFAGFNWGDVFGLGHQLNYQFTTSPDLEKMVAHSGSYVALLPWRHTLTLFGSHAKSKPEITSFDMDGTSWQLGLRYRIPLPSWHEVEQSVVAGFDFKRSDNNLAFGGASVFSQAVDVVQWIVGYEASRADRFGATSGGITVALSPGGIGGRNDDSDYEEARSDADSQYAYARLALERVTRLPYELSWVVRGEAQISTGNLLGSEQLGFGGATSLRGYDEREANGDGGFILVNELRGPAFQLIRHLGVTRLTDELVPLVFFDAGVAVVADPLAGEERSRELLSLGVGLRYTLATNVIARFDYGWQLRDSGISPTGDNSRGHVSVTIAW